jgi:hypothetical protein
MLADQSRHVHGALGLVSGFPAAAFYAGDGEGCYNAWLSTASGMSNQLNVELKER